ncbi:hypothetical protein CLOM_g24494 [Closterium sp. NIES-68]|nr:hypothetical protein CLOM_g24494 [Closterium sp. NIES-68]GJP75489.1 hypothetical protein CLOP_g5931 [Closterium sp. NIES-67]
MAENVAGFPSTDAREGGVCSGLDVYRPSFERPSAGLRLSESESEGLASPAPLVLPGAWTLAACSNADSRLQADRGCGEFEPRAAWHCMIETANGSSQQAPLDTGGGCCQAAQVCEPAASTTQSGEAAWLRLNEDLETAADWLAFETASGLPGSRSKGDINWRCSPGRDDINVRHCSLSSHRSSSGVSSMVYWSRSEDVGVSSGISSSSTIRRKPCSRRTSSCSDISTIAAALSPATPSVHAHDDASRTILCDQCSRIDAELACDPLWIENARTRISGAALAVVEAEQAAGELSARVEARIPDGALALGCERSVLGGWRAGGKVREKAEAVLDRMAIEVEEEEMRENGAGGGVGHEWVVKWNWERLVLGLTKLSTARRKAGGNGVRGKRQ